MSHKVIFLYDYTGIMAQPWLDAGYECWCFDGQHPSGITREGLHVKVGMWFDPYKLQEHVACIKKYGGLWCTCGIRFPRVYSSSSIRGSSLCKEVRG